MLRGGWRGRSRTAGLVTPVLTMGVEFDALARRPASGRTGRPAGHQQPAASGQRRSAGNVRALGGAGNMSARTSRSGSQSRGRGESQTTAAKHCCVALAAVA